MNKRHKYADVIIAWANGQRVQFKDNLGHWVDYPLSIMGTPSFHDPHSEWRIKPRTIMIGDMEVPEPLWEAPTCGSIFFIPDLFDESNFAYHTWIGDKYDFQWLKLNVCHLTREAAIAHAKALIKISGGTV